VRETVWRWKYPEKISRNLSTWFLFLRVKVAEKKKKKKKVTRSDNVKLTLRAGSTD